MEFCTLFISVFWSDYTQYGPIKNGRIKNQHSDFEKNKEPASTENSGLKEQIYLLRTSQH